MGGAGSFPRRSRLTASLGQALIQPGEGRGLEIIDALSVLLPGTQDALGFDLTDHGFYPVLTRELLYTAVTRARERVEIWGSEATLRAAIARPTERSSVLHDALWES